MDLGRNQRQLGKVGVAVQDRPDGVRNRLAAEKAVGGEHLVEKNAERPDIGLLVDGLAAGLFGTHVSRGAENDPGLGHGRGEGGRVADLHRAAVIGLAGEGAREPEVENLDVPVGGDLDVGGLQIPVHDAQAVGHLETLGDLGGQQKGLFGRNGPTVQSFGEFFTFDQFHDQEAAVLILFETVDGRHVRVLQLGQSRRLAFEACHAFLIVTEFRRQDLDRHLAVERGVLGPVHLTHAALAEQTDNFIVAEGFTDQGNTPAKQCESLF